MMIYDRYESDGWVGGVLYPFFLVFLRYGLVGERRFFVAWALFFGMVCIIITLCLRETPNNIACRT